MVSYEAKMIMRGLLVLARAYTFWLVYIHAMSAKEERAAENVANDRPD